MTGYFQLPVLPDGDRAGLENIIQICDQRLTGCNAKNIGEMLATIMISYRDHGLNDEKTLEAKKRISMQLLAEIPGWLLGSATLDAIRESAKSPFLASRPPTDAMILSAALPTINQIKDERDTAQKLLNRMNGQ